MDRLTLLMNIVDNPRKLAKELSIRSQTNRHDCQKKGRMLSSACELTRIEANDTDQPITNLLVNMPKTFKILTLYCDTK